LRRGGLNLKISASNVYDGTVLNVHHGSVNDDIEVVLDGSNTKLTAIITSVSSKTIGLTPGKRILVIFEAELVVLVTDAEGVKFSARNQLQGTVISVRNGEINAEVRVRLDGGEGLTAVIPRESAKALDLDAGKRVAALVKASNVMIGAKG
jgi:molybdate transport system regulatory protein